MCVLSTLRRCAGNFLFSDERGGITVEAVLWIPIYLGFVSFIADASMILHKQSQAMRIVQDTHRAFSTGGYTETAAVQATIEERLQRIAPSATVLTQDGNGVIRSVVTMQSGDLQVVGLISAITDIELTWANIHLSERI